MSELENGPGTMRQREKADLLSVSPGSLGDQQT